MARALLAALLLMPLFARGGDGFVLDLLVMEVPLEEALATVERAHRMGARHFTVPVLLCQDDRHSTEVFWCESFWNRKPAAPEAEARYRERLSVLGAELVTRGFSVAYLPLLLSGDGAWRGQLQPLSFSDWGRSYRSRMNELAEIARAAKASELIVATELNTLFVGATEAEQNERTVYWVETLAAFRKFFSGHTPVLIVGNWDQWDRIPFWKASDYIGLSAYYPLADSDTSDTSVRGLARRWRQWAKKLIQLSEELDRPLYFSEVGYSSTGVAAHKPWSWEGPLDLELQARLFDSFGQVWAAEPGESLIKVIYGFHLSRFILWSLTDVENPAADTGFSVLGKPAEPVVAASFSRRNRMRGEKDPRANDLPVIFTIDDLPMWGVTDVAERLDAYRKIRETLEAHHVPGIAFTNPAGIRDAREWEELARWRRSGILIANHTAHHIVRREVSEPEFLADVDEAERILDANLPGWDSPLRLFRFPNLDWGLDARATCLSIRDRNYMIAPVSLDSRDWAMGMGYHHAAAPRIEERPGLGLKAQAIAREELETLDSKIEQAREGARHAVFEGSPLLFIVHSTRYTRDYLDHILSRMERLGVRWAAPTAESLKGYAPTAACLPACIALKLCH